MNRNCGGAAGGGGGCLTYIYDVEGSTVARCVYMCITHIYDGEGSADARDHQAQDKLELGHQDVDRGRRGEAGHQRVGQIHDHEAHLH